MKLTDEQIAYCMECGVCAGSCPVTRNYEDFSPRLVIKHLLVDRKDAVTRSPVIWRCITCARCSVRCPALIDIPKVFMNIARRLERMDTILSQVIMKFCRLSQGFSYVPFHRNEPTGLLSGALKRREIISTLLVAHHTLIPFFSIWKSAQ